MTAVASPIAWTDDATFQRGIAEFNRGDYYDAHESWEELWDVADEPDRTFLQGLIQVTTAMHHVKGTGRTESAIKLFDRALAKLTGYDGAFGGVDLADLREQAAAWRNWLGNATSRPDAPSTPVLRPAR